jgi:hypothetical protein
MPFKTTATIASFGGKLLKLTHEASTTGCEMALNLYLPPSAGKTLNKVPILFYLAGLTCTGDNGAEKGFFQYWASQKGIAVVYPDTSPRTKPHMLLPSTFFTFYRARINKLTQEVYRFKARTSPTISEPAPASTLTQRPPPGPKTTKWNPTLPPSYQKPSLPRFLN